MSETREQVHFGADELRRAAVLCGREQTTQAGKARVFHDTMAICAWVQERHHWPTFRLKGDPEENQLAIALHRMVVRLAREDGMNPPPDPILAATAEDRVRRRVIAERPAAPEFWDLSQDEPEGSA